MGRTARKQNKFSEARIAKNALGFLWLTAFILSLFIDGIAGKGVLVIFTVVGTVMLGITFVYKQRYEYQYGDGEEPWIIWWKY